MAKVYILIERTWDYNDEYYTRSEGGRPVLATMVKANAEDVQRRFTFEKFNSCRLNEYWQDWNDMPEEVEALAAKYAVNKHTPLGGKAFSWDKNCTAAPAPQAFLEELYEYNPNIFFEICELDLC